ncbi:putative bifunctional diguanylate cyclase/phosphodiesterase [Undibacterium sp. Dicai25W]|uniref:putative bifunctional diguanylate cyclase/phosphodiesterase n=1 Tax=Undibacterium sp. Dicai25W TaxID=3413034 RepID=UPI003BF0433B
MAAIGLGLLRLIKHLILVFALLHCSDSFASPVQTDAVCGKASELIHIPGNEAAWTPGLGKLRLQKVCWLRIERPLPKDELLSFKSVWIDIALFDKQGKLLGNAPHNGEKLNAFVSANRISFIVQDAAYPIYARTTVSPSTSFYDEIDVAGMTLDQISLQARKAENTSVAQSAVLLGFALIMLAFGLFLRDINYGLFALFAFFQAAFIIFNDGLIFSVPNLPDWFPRLFAFTSWPSTAVLSIIVTRIGGFKEHSLFLHRCMLLMSVAYLTLVPMSFFEASLSLKTVVLQDYLSLLWFPLALLGLFRATQRHHKGTPLLILGLLPITVLWWTLSLINVQPKSWGWRFTPPSGTTLDVIQNLFLPTLLCISLAYRTFVLHNEAIRIAREDQLTGLANRERLAVQGETMLKNKLHPYIAVVALNVDRFKAINEALGHDIGDAALVEVGHRLSSIPNTVVGRSQSDQFFIIWIDIHTIDELQRHLKEKFFSPISVNQQTIDISLSAGVSLQTDVSMQKHMHCAEIALNAARASKSGWEVYRPDMETNKLGDLSLLSELRMAIQQNHLRIFLQPKVRVKDGAVVCAEALVRWQHPTRGMIPPYQFIPFAEHTGHISAITVWMLKEAMQLVAAWRAAGDPIQISINLSAFDLRNHNIVSIIETLRESNNASTEDIRLEVTESSVMSDANTAIIVLDHLRSLGYSIALDDFGTGYSSLAYLQKMPVSELKIDRAFVANVKPDTDASLLLLSTIELGQRLKLHTVAEGVETMEEWELVKQFGCDYVQGWYAAKPMPVSEFIQWRTLNNPFNYLQPIKLVPEKV